MRWPEPDIPGPLALKILDAAVDKFGLVYRLSMPISLEDRSEVRGRLVMGILTPIEPGNWVIKLENPSTGNYTQTPMDKLEAMADLKVAPRPARVVESARDPRDASSWIGVVEVDGYEFQVSAQHWVRGARTDWTFKSEREAVRAGTSFGAALGKCNARGIFHNDMKSDHALLIHGSVKFIDPLPSDPSNPQQITHHGVPWDVSRMASICKSPEFESVFVKAAFEAHKQEFELVGADYSLCMPAYEAAMINTKAAEQVVVVPTLGISF